jgi:hypothetical protein
MEEETDCPPYLTELADRLARETGVLAVIVPDGPGHWLLSLDGERVQLEAHYEGTRGVGAWVTIDGVTSRFFGGAGEFLRLWHDPESFHGGFASLPSPEEGTVVPAVVQQIAAVFRVKLRQDVSVGFVDDYWVVRAKLGTSAISVLFTSRKGRWGCPGITHSSSSGTVKT